MEGPMNRSQAIRELEQLIAWSLATWFEGRCPRCGVTTRSEDSVLVSNGSSAGENLALPEDQRGSHFEACPLRTFDDRTEYLCQEFGLALVYGAAGDTRQPEDLYWGPIEVVVTDRPLPEHVQFADGTYWTDATYKWESDLDA
jgi:hypothetical protein